MLKAAEEEARAQAAVLAASEREAEVCHALPLSHPFFFQSRFSYVISFTHPSSDCPRCVRTRG